VDRTSERRRPPSVERLLAEVRPRLADAHAAAAVTTAARAVVDEERAGLRAGAAPTALRDLADRVATALRPGSSGPGAVINATGVIVHTNLGRAPLAAEAQAALADAADGYLNLEYELDSGERGSRQSHVEGLLRQLTGADTALAVNNCAAAVLLACAALAEGRAVIVSRGQLVEIGGSFRIPDVVARSGARLVEVGTTNRTRLADYAAALDAGGAGAILRAHPSNFRTLGFVEEVPIERLCGLAREKGVSVIDDVGSGVLAERVPELADEPQVRRSVAAGADAVCFSGDKLLGGPQAGLIVGTAEAVDRCRRHPLARALRIDKLSLAALAATLRLYLDPKEALARVPVLRMLAAPEVELQARAERLRDALATGGANARVLSAAAKVGGGALPLLELEGPVCALDPAPLALDELAQRLRTGDPAVVGRAREGWLLLDPRTLDDSEADAAAAAVLAAFER
jgi:L-seryl-tRNA(Ser) seleniumtransferase